jgi:hypothetical protein
MLTQAAGKEQEFGARRGYLAAKRPTILLSSNTCMLGGQFFQLCRQQTIMSHWLGSTSAKVEPIS